MKYRLLLLCVIILFMSCNNGSPDVDLRCDLNKNSTYIIKWDYSYESKGDVEIFTSHNPDNFKNARFIGKYPISQCMVEINNKTVTKRNYFLLRFDNKYEYKLGTHFVAFDSIQNYRDIGGYRSESGKRIKWGKIYRSGMLNNASVYDINKIKSLKPNTLLDIRATIECNESYFDKFDFFKNIRYIPFDSGLKSPAKHIYNEEYKVGDAVLYLQDMLIGISQNSKNEIRTFFDILLDEKSYPIIISDSYGMHQINFAMTVLYYALDIPHEVLLEDAMLSNKYFNKKSLWNLVKDQSENIQCISTTLLTVRRRYIDSLHYYIDRKYGSINNYLETEIGLTKAEKLKLRHLLLE